MSDIVDACTSWVRCCLAKAAHRQHSFIVGLLGVACFIAVFLTILRVEHRVNDQAAKIARTRQGQIVGCERLNRTVVQENKAEYGDYLLLKAVILKGNHLTEGSNGAPGSEALTLALDAQEWIPPTDCIRAIDTVGSTYKLAPAIRFVDHLPPSSALGTRATLR